MSRHLTFRLTEEEIALLDAGCRALGLKSSAFLHFALRQAVGGTDVGQRLACIEQTVAEIVELLRSGTVSLAFPREAEGDQDDGMREELTRSLRDLLEDGI